MNYLVSLIGKCSPHTAGETYRKPDGEICAIFTRRCTEMINLNVAMIYCPSPGKRPQTLITPLRPKLIQGAELPRGNPAFASSSAATSITTTSSSSAG